MYDVASVLIRLCSFLIPGFVSENVQIKSIASDKFSCLQVLFLSRLIFFFYKIIFCVLVPLFGFHVHVCVHTFSFPQNNLRYAMKFTDFPHNTWRG